MLHKQTTKKELIDVLDILMRLPTLSEFRLVGGTALSLLLGHRLSEDIDLFTHLPYGSVDFRKIQETISKEFPYVYNRKDLIPQLASLPEHVGITLHVGAESSNAVKVDIMNWSEEFLDPPTLVEGIRIATIRDIGTMKLETISNRANKKDFWDLSEILGSYKLTDLIKDYETKYPYNSIEDVKEGFLNISKADLTATPICLKNISWTDVKEHIRQEVSGYFQIFQEDSLRYRSRKQQTKSQSLRLRKGRKP